MSRKNSLANKQARRTAREAQWAMNGGRGPAKAESGLMNRAQRRQWMKQNKQK